MQLFAPVIMGVVGQKQKSKGLDIGGLAQIWLGGGKQRAAQSNNAGGIFKDLISITNLLII